MRDEHSENEKNKLADGKTKIESSVKAGKNTLKQNKYQPSAKLTNPVNFFLCHVK